ncbi:MAG: ATP synthase F1 subunit epsilon [Planctomycetota bacterium]|nr:ATP synthase F1 subunit epsilon [Planctomycetota bacterium]
MATIRCVVVTPEKTELDLQADSLTVPLYDGEIGILPGRAPMVGRLGFGIMKVKQGSSETSHYVDGGFVQVRREAVYVLTDRMLKPESIDKAQASSDLEKALAIVSSSPETFALKDRAVSQARAKLRLQA